MRLSNFSSEIPSSSSDAMLQSLLGSFSAAARTSKVVLHHMRDVFFFRIYRIHLILSIIRQAVIELKHILFCLLPLRFSTILTLGGDAWWSSCWHASKTIMLSPNIYLPPSLGPSSFPRKLIYGSLWERPAAVAAWMGAIRSQE